MAPFERKINFKGSWSYFSMTAVVEFLGQVSIGIGSRFMLKNQLKTKLCVELGATY